MQVAVERAGPVAFPRRVVALVAVGVARVLVRLSPARLQRVLRLVSRGARPATAGQAARAREAVVAVSVRCAGQGCLQRSVATALSCRIRGVWPRWCTGVRTHPFRAHAWVEVEGHPVGEPDDARLYHTILSVPCPPRGSSA